MTQYVGYSRISTKKQEKGYSHHRQNASIERFAELYGLDLVEIRNEQASRSVRPLDRPVLSSLVRDYPDAILLVEAHDRLAAYEPFPLRIQYTSHLAQRYDTRLARSVQCG